MRNQGPAGSKRLHKKWSDGKMAKSKTGLIFLFLRNIEFLNNINHY
jgi:hypothetical protein